MEQTLNNDQAINRYLLGQMSEQEQSQFEERYFADDNLFEELRAVEGELIDAYVRGELSPPEREQFEKHFLTSPKRRQRVEFARTMINTLALPRGQRERARDCARPAPAPWWRSLPDFLRSPRQVIGYALAVALLAIAIGGPCLMIKVRRLQHQLDQMQAQQNALPGPDQDVRQQLAQQLARNNQLAGELEREKGQRAQLEQDLAQLRTQGSRDHPTPSTPSQPSPGLASIILTPGGSVRGGGQANKLGIDASITQVQIQIKLAAADYKTYRAVLQKVGGAELHTWNDLKPQTTRDGKLIVLSLPAASLPLDDYQVTLSGATATGSFEDLGNYFLQIRKK